MHGRGHACVAGGHAWQWACMAWGTCMTGGMHRREHAWHGVYMAGDMHGRGCAWQEGHAWHGCMHGRGACMVGAGMCA